ncbi:hypothetical protein M2151_002796, partial [Lachnospiraceae bacterium PH1-22]
TSYRLIVGNNFNSAVLKTACFCQGTDYGAFTNIRCCGLILVVG